MTLPRPFARTLAVLTLGSLLTALSVPPAHASGSGIDPPADAPPTVSSGTEQESAGSCRLYASSSGYGQVCPSAAGASFSQILLGTLDGESLPSCWDTEPGAGFRPPEERLGEAGQWWSRRCVSGIDLTSMRRTGQISFAYLFVFLPPGEQVRLTEKQERAVALLARDAQIPYPVVQTWPVAAPRVGADIAFQLTRDTRQAPPIQEFGGVAMRSRVVHLEVLPQGRSGDKVSCDGFGTAVDVDDTPTSVHACWYRYDRSSATLGEGEARDRYSLVATAYWRVEYSANGGPWTELGTFAKEAINPLRVTEVQTLVIR